MLKKVSVILFATLLFACASQNTTKGFKGTGDFDTAEAAKTRVSLGLTYLKNGNYSQAKFNLDKALEFAPRSGEANYAMAFYYQQVDEVERAHEYYKKAINFSKNGPDILNSYGAFLCRQGDYELAKEYFLKSVDDKSYISTASTYENLAICYENQGKLEEAILYFNSALNHQPTRASSLLYISQLYVQTNRWEKAKKSLWKYERNASVSDETLWLSFQIARGQQDLRAAIEYAEILKSMYPDSPHTQNATNALGKFQPDMTVTQKSRDTSQSNIRSFNDLGNNEQTVQFDDDNAQKRAPASGNGSFSKRSVEPVVNVNIEESVDEFDVAENVENVENDTELALKEAFKNTEVVPQSAVTIPSSQAENAVSVKAVEESDTAEIPKEVYDAINSASNTTDASDENLTNVDIETPDTLMNTDTSFHLVKPKENLYRISLKYNVKIKKLLEWNNLDDASDIRVGTQLWVKDPNINE